MANIRTFKMLQDEVLAWLDETGDTDVTLTLVKQAIRAAHEKRLTQERWAFMLSAPKTFPTVIGQQTYLLDPEFFRLMYVKDLTNVSFLTEVTDTNMLDPGYDWSVGTATPGHFALWGHSEVLAQPVAAAIVTVTSSNGGDGALALVTLTGTLADGSMATETVACLGSSTNLFASITKVSKGSAWAGTMTLTAGFVTLLTLGPTEYGKSYQKLYLFESPSSVASLEYRYYRQPSALVLDGDRPDYPTPFEELLVWDALCDLATYNSYTQPMIQYWQQRRDELVLAMGQVTNQAQTINQAASYTDYVVR